MKNFLIIDGNSIINRAFYGVKPLSTKDGFPTNAVFGFINIIKKHVKPRYTNESGSIVTMEAPIHVSNVKKVEVKKAATKKKETKVEDAKVEEKTAKKTTAKKTTKKVKES